MSNGLNHFTALPDMMNLSIVITEVIKT